MASNLEIPKNNPESKIIDETKKELNALSLEVKQNTREFDSYEDLKLDDYLDEDMKYDKEKQKNSITAIQNFLDPKKIKQIEKGKTYQYGDIMISKSADKWKLTVKSGNSTYFEKTNRIKDLSSPLTLASSLNTLDDCERFTAFINYTACFLKNKKTGTDDIGKVELDNFGSNLIEDNNPFYVSGDKLYFNNGGHISDITIISQNSLDRMIKGVKLEDLAKFFTNRVKYTFDNQLGFGQ